MKKAMPNPMFSFHIFFSDDNSFTYQDENLNFADASVFLENLGLDLLSHPLQKLTPENKSFLIDYFSERASKIDHLKAIVKIIKIQDENNFFMVFHCCGEKEFSYEYQCKVGLYLAAVHSVENVKHLQLNELPKDEIYKLYQIFEEQYLTEINPLEEMYSHLHIKSNLNKPLRITSQKGIANRTCRFCFQSKPTVSFGQRAHAISKGLGNVSIFCLDECDECNNYFGRTIEKDLITFLDFQRMFTVQKKNANYLNQTIVTNDGGTVFIKSDSSEFQKNVIQQKDHLEVRLMPLNTFIPQHICKALCKAALAVIEEQSDLDILEETIKWVRSDTVDKIDSLMTMGISYLSYSNNETSISIWTRKGDDHNIPFKIVKLSLGLINIYYSLPFALNQNNNLELECIFKDLNFFKNEKISWGKLGDTDAQIISTTLKLFRS